MRSILWPAVALALGLGLAPAQSATAADIGDVVCNGGVLNLQFNPGLTFSRKTVRLSGSGELGICSSKKYPKITGGTIRVESSLTAVCPGPIGPGYAKVSINWNDGSKTTIDQSTFRGDASSFSLEGGGIAAGAFAGGTARANGRTTSNLIEIGAGCVLSGVTSVATTIDQFAAGDI
ncbi:hypothetical protein [Herbidospora mongoliensis]|uniref:hypothetical protein n=1 Tax=Herbidospora mongoliensis TaxID=688067 RepID=UPI00082B097D|nr:hypothetical protein [Herbidospora mongoliensis]